MLPDAWCRKQSLLPPLVLEPGSWLSLNVEQIVGTHFPQEQADSVHVPIEEEAAHEQLEFNEWRSRHV